MKVSKSRGKRSPRKSRIDIKVRDGMFLVQGLNRWYKYWQDPHHLMLTVPWVGFVGFSILLYLGLNTLFAGLYLLGGDSIVNARVGNFEDAFFFSVQTIASIGYGVLSPKTTYAHIIVLIESMAGLFLIALLTGITFSRFSRPTAKVMFSKLAVIMPLNHLPTLMFRAANQRHNQILEAQMTVSLSQDEIVGGKHMRRFYELKLTRSRTPTFSLPWTLMHPIDEHSPLYGFSAESLDEAKVQIIVSLSGMDETVSQNVHSRHVYGAKDIILNHQLVDIIHIVDDRNRYIDFSDFDRVEPL